MRAVTFIITLLYGFIPVFSQYTVSGFLSDSMGNNIPFAHVVLTDSIEKVIYNYTTTDKEGYYKLNITSSGSYVIAFSALGFSEKSVPLIHFDQSDLKINATLEKKAFELNEVIVNGRRPITLKKDTVVFDVKAFTDGSEEIVEDILRKLPGLNIDHNGTIRVGNREIEKVLVEGDDFFEKGYKILTKNMPAQPIDQVELLQNYSDNRLIKAIKKNDKTALNIKLKEDAKNQWFANTKAGYGITNRHTLLVNLFNFSKKSKYYFLTNMNNIGEDALDEIALLVNKPPDNNLLATDITPKSLQLIDYPLFETDFKQNRTRFNNDKLCSSNAILSLSKKVKLKVIGFFNDDEQSFSKKHTEKYLTKYGDFTNTESFDWNKDISNSFGRVNLKYDNGLNHIVEMNTAYNYNNRRHINNFLFNNQSAKEKMSAQQNLFDQQITFTSRLNNKNILVFNGHYAFEKLPQHLNLDGFLYDDLIPDAADFNKTSQINQSQQHYFRLEVACLQKQKDKNVFEIRLGNIFTQDVLVSNFEISDDQDNISPGLTEYQNNIQWDINRTYASLSYSRNMRHFDVFANLSVYRTDYRKRALERSKTAVSFTPNPYLGFKWRPDNKNKVICSFSHDIANSEPPDEYDHWILKNYRLISKGINHVNRLRSSSFVINHEYGGWSNRLNIHTLFFFTRNQDYLSEQISLTQNLIKSEKTRLHGRENIGISTNIDRFFKSISSNIKLNVSLFHSDFIQFVNDTKLPISANNISTALELRSAFKGIFNFHIGSTWKTYLVNSSAKNSFTNNNCFLDLLFRPHENLNFKIQNECYVFGHTSSNKAYYFLDFDCRYNVKKNKLSFSIEGRNLSDTRQYRSASISEISTAVSQYNLLPRSVLLKAEYRF